MCVCVCVCVCVRVCMCVCVEGRQFFGICYFPDTDQGSYTIKVLELTKLFSVYLNIRCVMDYLMTG